MKYYDGHESVYQKLEKNGGTSWSDRVGGQGLDVEHASVREVLAELFSQVTFSGSPLQAMDMGCGTGTISGYLAERGFRTLGIDVSASAIRIAQRVAAEKGLNEAKFAVADIVNYPDPQPTFDLIVDAQCMHCIVFDQDRAKALVHIRRLLKPGGVFVMNTKSTGSAEGITHSPEKFSLDEQGILWFRTGSKMFDESKEVNGEWHMPQRRILPPETLRKELAEAGFSIRWDRFKLRAFSAICAVA